MNPYQKYIGYVQLGLLTGQGRMVDGKYQNYSDADKKHMKGAEANRQAAYQDISSSSLLGRYFGNKSDEGDVKKKKNTAASTLLGGGGSNVLGG